MGDELLIMFMALELRPKFLFPEPIWRAVVGLSLKEKYNGWITVQEKKEYNNWNLLPK